MKKLTLEEFKNFVKQEREKKQDIVDIPKGKMTIHRENLNKYLERYMCHDESDLDNTLYRSFGIWLKVID